MVRLIYTRELFLNFLQAESGNGYFDCKVLSRQHSLLMYEDEKFYLLDLGKKCLFGYEMNLVRLDICLSLLVTPVYINFDRKQQWNIC